MRVTFSILACALSLSPLAAKASSIEVKSRIDGAGQLIPAVATVEPNESLHVVVQPDAGFRLKQISGCNGQYENGIFVVENPRYSCVIAATFIPDNRQPVTQAESGAQSALNTVPTDKSAAIAASGASSSAAAVSKKSNILRFILVANQVANSVTVTASVLSGLGSITPLQQSVLKGNTASVTVTPATGYVVSSVVGCGLSTSSSGALTTPALNANCTINATFTQIINAIWDTFKWDQATWA